jgi:hypothetical protein
MIEMQPALCEYTTDQSAIRSSAAREEVLQVAATVQAVGSVMEGTNLSDSRHRSASDFPLHSGARRSGNGKCELLRASFMRDISCSGQDIRINYNGVHLKRNTCSKLLLSI